jgi:hypothetical protein
LDSDSNKGGNQQPAQEVRIQERFCRRLVCGREAVQAKRDYSCEWHSQQSLPPYFLGGLLGRRS